MSPEEAAALAAAIVRRARELALPALLDALEALGYSSQDLEFRSHYTSGHTAFLIESVELQAHPRRAFICLNIGLLAAQSPLPSYFFSALQDGQHDRDALKAFLTLLDQPLLKERAYSEYPERDRRRWASWEQDKELLLRLMALSSPSSLHWLFQRTFPELAVLVERAVEEEALVTDQVLLGSTALGEGRALGGQVRLTAGAVSVTLFCEEPCSLAGVPWAQEAARRFESYIKPLLLEQSLFLSLWLVFFDSDTTARLVMNPKLPDSFLGYDPLGHPADRTQRGRSLQRVLLHSGRTDGS